MDNETHEPQQQPAPIYAKKRADLGIPLAIVIAGALVGGAILFSDNTRPATGSITAPERQLSNTGVTEVPVAELALRPEDHILGNPNAEVLVIEYSDTECPFCKKFHETMVQVMDQYAETGTVAWVYRHFPLDQIHPKARKEAEALECANELGGNDAFWKYVDNIFAITPANNGLDAAELPRIAGAIGLDAAAFSTCLASGKYADRVERDLKNGVNAGAKGTPYTVVWNKRTGKQQVVGGAYPIENMKSILDGVIGS